MSTKMFDAAVSYYEAGLCTIPLVPKEKRPALNWEDYLTTRPTPVQVKEWFGNGHNYNLGIVHGAVSRNYVVLDFDHDAGLFDEMKRRFANIFAGRIILSGSGEGYHIPIHLGELPGFGHDTKKDRPVGNRTWKTGWGDVNIRAQWCQSAAPPSIHPSGSEYTIIQDGEIIWLPELNNLMEWLNTLDTPKAAKAAVGNGRNGSAPKAQSGDDLMSAVKATWTALRVFQYFGLANGQQKEPGGGIRLLGNGGLLLPNDDDWYNHTWETGGGAIEAWIVCRFGTAALEPGQKNSILRQVLIEMAQAANMDLGRYTVRSDVQYIDAPQGSNFWSQQYPAWDALRA